MHRLRQGLDGSIQRGAHDLDHLGRKRRMGKILHGPDWRADNGEPPGRDNVGKNRKFLSNEALSRTSSLCWRYSSRAFENANELTRRVVSSRISGRVIGGSARCAQFSRSHRRQLTPIGVTSVFTRSPPAALVWRAA